MRFVTLHPLRGNRPDALLRVDLAPSRAARFARSRRRQYRELDCQLDYEADAIGLPQRPKELRNFPEVERAQVWLFADALLLHPARNERRGIARAQPAESSVGEDGV